MDSFVREGVIRLRTELVETKLQAPDISEMTKSIEESNRQTREAIEQTTKLAEETERTSEVRVQGEEEFQRQTDESRRAQEEAQQRQQAIREETVRLSGALRTAGDGAFTFARGLALSSLEAGEGLEQTLETIARIQGQFDLFRGAVDVFAGAAEAAKSANALSLLARESNNNFKLVRGTLSSVVGFLGPTGAIVAGSVAAAGAVALIYTTLAEDAETTLDRAQDRFDEFVRDSEKRAFELNAALERSAAERRFQSAEEQGQSLRNDLGSVRRGLGRNSFEENQAAIAARDAAQREFERLQRASATGPRFGNTPEADARRQALIQQREAARERLEGLGGAVTDPERQQLLREGQERLELLRQESGLLEDIAANEQQLATARERSNQSLAAQERRELESREAELVRQQERLRREQEAIAGRERQAAIDRANLSPGARARLDAGLGRLRNNENVTEEFLNSLRGIAGSIAGPEIEAFRARLAGLDPVDPNAEVAQLREEIAKLSTEISGLRETNAANQGSRAQQQGASDAAFDAAVDAFNRTGDLVEAFSNRLRDLESQLQESGG